MPDSRRELPLSTGRRVFLEIVCVVACILLSAGIWYDDGLGILGAVLLLLWRMEIR